MPKQHKPLNSSEFASLGDLALHSRAAPISDTLSALYRHEWLDEPYRVAVGYASEIMAAISEDPRLVAIVGDAMRERRDRAFNADAIAAKEAVEAVITKVLEETFSHVPYWFVQSALGVETGDMASIYESAGGQYLSKFGNEVGAEILHTIIREIGMEAFMARKDGLFSPDKLTESAYRLPEEYTDADIDFVAKMASAYTILHVASVFRIHPGILGNATEHDLSEFCRAYVKYEISNREPSSAPAP